MSKYLLEVGVEELPYKFIPMAISQLKTGFEGFFETNNIQYKEVKVMATPRRLAVLADGLALSQPDIEKVVKGPIAHIAFDENNNLTKAGEGFAKKNGVDKSDLYVEDNYVYAKISIKGKCTKDLLEENVPLIFSKLQGPHFMRWGNNDVKFSRPIRWILSLLDNEQVKIRIIDKDSSNITNGHRFSEQNIIINNPDEYVDKLRDAKVIVNQEERKEKILELTNKEASKLNAVTKISDDLLEEVTYICEWPIAVTCDFDLEYLTIPQEVAVTVMETHQRYFALYSKDNGKLINKFVTITNYVGNEFENIKAGNLRVIKARLDDAVFFYNEDIVGKMANGEEKSLQMYVKELEGMTFQKGFGSIYRKKELIKELVREIYTKEDDVQKSILRIAELCKADLATRLVFEFTELQGFIGADYAKKTETDAVSNGIKEHYYPLNADSELAKGIEGRIVGIADKIITICAVFTYGKKPTGSSDPLGARRAAFGIIRTILDMENEGLHIDINKLITITLSKFDNVKENTQEEIQEFLRQRLEILLSEKENYDKNILKACMSIDPLIDLKKYKERVDFVTNGVDSLLAENAKRVGNLLNGYSDFNMDEDLAKNSSVEAEACLYKLLNPIFDEVFKGANGISLKKVHEELIQINQSVVKFFDEVHIMDKDEKVKNNRLALLSRLDFCYKNFADFRKI